MHSMVLLELRRSCTVQHALLTFRPKLRIIVEPKPAAMNDHLHLHTRTWVCNASLLVFSLPCLFSPSSHNQHVKDDMQLLSRLTLSTFHQRQKIFLPL